MRRLSIIIFAVVFIFILAACNQTAKPTDSNDAKEVDGDNTEEVSEENADEEENNDSDLTLQEVFEKTMETNDGLDSFSITMDLQQTMNINEEEMDVGSVIEMDIITDPISMKQNMVMDMDELGKQEMEMYFAEEGFYVFDPMEDQWMKFPNEFSDELLQLSNNQADVGNQLNQFEDFLEDFTFEQDENNYILTLQADGEKFNELLTETIKNSMPQELGLDVSIFDNISFDNVNYDIVINKETFYFSELNVKMDYEMEIEGEKIKVNQDVKSKYENHNNVDAITIPKEAIDNAVEVEL